MRRSEERRAAVMALYEHDITGRSLEDMLPTHERPFASALASQAAERAAELDGVLARHAHGWSVARIHPLERAIMSVALVEMLHPGEVPGEAPIPAEGAIEEAVRCAKTFCGAEAPGFVNGVLAAALRELRQNEPMAGSARGA